MLKICVILLSFLVLATSQKFGPKNIEIASRALSSLIEIFSEKYYSRFVLLVEKNYNHLERLADKVLRNVSTPVELRTYNSSIERPQIDFSKCYIILFNSYNVKYDFLSDNRFCSNTFITIMYIKLTEGTIASTTANMNMFQRGNWMNFYFINHIDRNAVGLRNHTLEKPHTLWKKT